MNKEGMKNIVILKNLPSNLIEEAIMVVKDKSKIKNFDFCEYIKDGGENFSTNRERREKSRVIQGYMKEEDLRKMEQVKKEDRKYVIKEAEIVVSNYISKLEKPLSEREIKKLKKSYKRVRKLNFLLGIITLISIILAIIL